MAGLTLKCESLNTQGKEANGFYKNIEKFDKWQEKYNIDSGVKELFYELNNRGTCFSYDHSRIHTVASILYTEGYAYTFPKEEKTVDISEAHYCDTDEIYASWYTCPNCEERHIAKLALKPFKYCPDCGSKINWKDGDQ